MPRSSKNRGGQPEHTQHEPTLVPSGKSLTDAGSNGAWIGEPLMDSLREMFRHWYRHRDGRHSASVDALKHSPRLQMENAEHLGRWDVVPPTPTDSLCRDLFGRFDQLWILIDHPGLEPTNNRAELTLRHAVIGRNLSHGTQSVSGSRFVAPLLRVIETYQRQRNALDIITSSHEAQAHGPDLFSQCRGDSECAEDSRCNCVSWRRCSRCGPGGAGSTPRFSGQPTPAARIWFSRGGGLRRRLRRGC